MGTTHLNVGLLSRLTRPAHEESGPILGLDASLRWAHHPVIVIIRKNKDYIRVLVIVRKNKDYIRVLVIIRKNKEYVRVLLYSYFPTIAGWGSGGPPNASHYRIGKTLAADSRFPTYSARATENRTRM